MGSLLPESLSFIKAKLSKTEELWRLSRCCWRWSSHVVFLYAVRHCHSLNNHSHETFCQTTRRKKL